MNGSVSIRLYQSGDFFNSNVDKHAPPKHLGAALKSCYPHAWRIIHMLGGQVINVLWYT